MKNLLVFIVLSFWFSTAFSQTFSLRDTLNYNLNDIAVHVIYTYPPEPYQPVYAWRTHIPFDYSYPGIHNQDAKLIGYTDDRGVLSIVVKLPHDPIHCGWFYNERVAVGSVDSRKSNSLNFTIKDGAVHAGPMHPALTPPCSPLRRLLPGHPIEP